MLYNDPSTITYVADISAIHQLYVYIYIYIISMPGSLIKQSAWCARCCAGAAAWRSRAPGRAYTRLVTSCREQHAIARSINRYLYIYVMNAIACRSRHGTAQRARPGACHAVRALPEIDVSGHGLPYSGFNILLTYNVIFKCSLNMFT